MSEDDSVPGIIPSVPQNATIEKPNDVDPLPADDQGLAVESDALDCEVDASTETASLLTLDPSMQGRMLYAYGRDLQKSFEREGDSDNLQIAIISYSTALDLLPHDDPILLPCTWDLAICYITRLQLTGSLDDLDSAIECFQQTLDIEADPDINIQIEQVQRLTNLAAVLKLRFEMKGAMEDLDTSIQHLEQALDHRPVDHPRRSDSLYLLADALSDRYSRTANLEDLEKSIEHHQSALALRPEGHPDRPRSLNSLGSCLRVRFNNAGDPADLTKAIECHHEATMLIPDNDPGQFLSLVNLAACLRRRGNHIDSVEDLDQAIEYFMKLLALFPAGRREHVVPLSNLGMAWRDRFGQTRILSDLNTALDYHYRALELRQEADAGRGTTLMNIATCLSDRIETAPDQYPSDLEKAVEFYEEALTLIPKHEPEYIRTLSNLASHLHDRFMRTQRGDDLKRCMDVYMQLVDPESDLPGHAGRRSFTVGFARLIVVLATSPSFPHDDESVDISSVMDVAISLFRDATNNGADSIIHRLDAAQAWRAAARWTKDESEFEAHTTTLRLLEIAVARSRSLEAQFSQLMRVAIRHVKNVACDAAALALEQGDPELAVSLLEQGRTVIFRQLGHFRTVLEDVREVAPELAERFSSLSQLLDKFVLSGGRDVPTDKPSKVFEDDVSRHQKISREWARVVDQIRELDGFESFLLPPTFSHLQQAAIAGPVIIVNISEIRSDAIIVLTTGPPIVVRLPVASIETVTYLGKRFAGRPAEMNEQDAIDALREIWNKIVEPVVNALRGIRPKLKVGCRLWWCPAGPASRLPLHAAGPYRDGQRDLIHLATSSYTPTLEDLIRSRRSRPLPSTTRPDLFVVSHPETPNEPPLPNADNEMRIIKSLIPQATFVDRASGTREAVLSGIAEHRWVHLACHGHHNPTQPFLSHFSMHDGKVTMLNLIERNLPRAELAVLSACHSAKACEDLPDEALHPAAGMLFAGFDSVVATLWALEDGVGPALTEEFYKLMVTETGEAKEASYAAVALRKVMNKLGRDGVPLMQRINLVHFGI